MLLQDRINEKAVTSNPGVGIPVSFASDASVKPIASIVRSFVSDIAVRSPRCTADFHACRDSIATGTSETIATDMTAGGQPCTGI